MPDTIPVTGSTIDRENPWPGLAPFTEDQAAFFYGRDEEIRALTRLMERKALTVLFGQSGLGKSSLLQAGVFPRLRAAHFCPIYIRLDHSDGSPAPSEQVKAMVTAESKRAGTWTKPSVAKPGESLWEFFHHRDDRLVDPNGRTILPVLVFDQFEELFTLGAAAGAQRDRAVAFMSQLAELVENRPSERLVERLDKSADEMDAFDFGRTDYRVCISLREDYLPHLEVLKTIMPALMENRMRLSRMTGTQALDAVVKPGGQLVSEDVARAIVEFVAGARGGSIERLAEVDVEPPLLSVICHELNERRRALGQSQITADLVSGNRREILSDFYERSVADLPEAMRRFVEDKLLTKSGFRDNLALETALEEPGVTRPLIDTLVARRLIRIEDRIGAQRVELTHDVLADVVRASRDARQQRLLLEQARTRERQVVEHAARRTRRLRWLVAGLVLAVVGLSIGAVIGLRAQRIATRRASQSDLLFASRLLGEGKTADGLAYLVRAARRDPANSILTPRILTALAGRSFLLPEGAPLALPSPADFSARYLADGRTVMVQCQDGVVRAIDTAAWRIPHEFRFGKKIVSGGWDVARENNGIVCFGLDDGSVIVCDAGTGAPRFAPLRPPEGKPADRLYPRLSSDGRWVGAGVKEHVWLWDAESGQLRATLPSFEGTFRFSPDGRKVMTIVVASVGTHRAQIWSLPDGQPVGEPIGVGSGALFELDFNADGRSVLLVAQGRGRFYDATTGAPLAPAFPIIRSYSPPIFTPDGRQLILGGDRSAQILDVPSGKPVFPALPHGGPVYSAVLSRDGKLLLTTCVDGFARIWRTDTGTLVADPSLQQSQYAPATLSPDGTQAIQFTTAGSAYRLRVGRDAAAPLTVPNPYLYYRATFLRDAPNRVLRVLHNRAVAIDPASGREVEGGFTYPQPLVTSVARASVRSFLSPDQRILIVRIGTGWHVWRRQADGTIEEGATLEGMPNLPATFAFHPTGEFVACAGIQMPGRSVIVWSLKTGRKVATFKRESAVVAVTQYGAEFSPDGHRLGFKTEDNVVHICEFPGEKEIITLRLGGRAEIYSWRFSPDGKQIFTGDFWGGLQFWDAESGRLIASAQRHRDTAWLLATSRDGRRLLTGSPDGTAQVWDIATHSPQGAILMHSSFVRAGAFSPDGRRIATATAAGDIRFWDAVSSQPIDEPMRHEGGGMRGIEFSPDGKFLLSDGGDSSPYSLWAAPPDGHEAVAPSWLLRLATICAGKRLSDDGEFIPAADEIARIDDVRRDIEAIGANSANADWGRWLLEERTKRAIAPGFSITPMEADKFAAPGRYAALEDRLTLLRQQGNLAEADVVERRVIDLAREVFGVDAPNLSALLMRRADSLLGISKWVEAETLAREALALREKTLPPEDWHVPNSRAALALALYGQNRVTEAEPLLASSYLDLKASESVPENTRVGRVPVLAAALGLVRVGQNRYAEAEPLLLASYTALKKGELKLSDNLREILPTIAAALARSYEATNQPEKAAEWRKKADSTPDADSAPATSAPR